MNSRWGATSVALKLAAGQAWAAERLGHRNLEGGSATMRLPLRPPDTLHVQLEEIVIGFRHDRPTCWRHTGTRILRLHPTRRRQHVLRAGSSNRLRSTAAGNCSFYLQTTFAAPSCSENTWRQPGQGFTPEARAPDIRPSSASARRDRTRFTVQAGRLQMIDSRKARYWN